MERSWLVAGALGYFVVNWWLLLWRVGLWIFVKDVLVREVWNSFRLFGGTVVG